MNSWCHQVSYPAHLCPPSSSELFSLGCFSPLPGSLHPKTVCVDDDDAAWCAPFAEMNLMSIRKFLAKTSDDLTLHYRWRVRVHQLLCFCLAAPG
jgi:hypothetical protein